MEDGEGVRGYAVSHVINIIVGWEEGRKQTLNKIFLLRRIFEITTLAPTNTSLKIRGNILTTL